MLTRKQHELLMFIHERMRESGVPPSFDEMKEALDLKSKSGIHRLITALEERGFIRRLPYRARALEVIRLPEGVGVPPRGRFNPSVVEGGLTGRDRGEARPEARHETRQEPRIEGRFDPRSDARPDGRSDPRVPGRIGAAAPIGHDMDEGPSVTIPVMGRIAAGTPISAIQTPSHSIAISPDFLATGEHFALEVRGDSMIEAGILDGDTVIIRRQDVATTGDIVVALIDAEEATLKRFRRRGSSIALEAANPAYETRVLGPDRVNIQGKLVSLLRRY